MFNAAQPYPTYLMPPVVFETIPAPRYEYRVIAIDLAEAPPLDELRLAALGQDRWVLAGVLDTAPATRGRYIHYYFIRTSVEQEER